jgi:hypothetical protein
VLDDDGNFVVKTKGRIIFNASSTNMNRIYGKSPTGYDDAHTAISALTPGALQATFDETDAFLMKPINWRYRLGVVVSAPHNEGELHAMCYVPFGVTFGPQVQMKYSREVCAMVSRGALLERITKNTELHAEWQEVVGDTILAPPAMAVLMIT